MTGRLEAGNVCADVRDIGIERGELALLME